jgi:uncharacterized protein
MPERDLVKLLETISPRVMPGEYVFVSVADGATPPEAMAQALCTFREREGMTLIIEAEVAEKHALKFESKWKWIICDVHSDLSAVGFIAAISTKLAQHGISCNPVSAFHHDHLFVPADRADEAVRLLSNLS